MVGVKLFVILIFSFLGEELQQQSTLQLVQIYFDTATFDDIEREKKIKTESIKTEVHDLVTKDLKDEKEIPLPPEIEEVEVTEAQVILTGLMCLLQVQFVTGMEFADYCMLKTREKALRQARKADIEYGWYKLPGYKPKTGEGKIKLLSWSMS